MGLDGKFFGSDGVELTQFYVLLSELFPVGLFFYVRSEFPVGLL